MAVVVALAAVSAVVVVVAGNLGVSALLVVAPVVVATAAPVAPAVDRTCVLWHALLLLSASAQAQQLPMQLQL